MSYVVILGLILYIGYLTIKNYKLSKKSNTKGRSNKPSSE